MRNAGLEETQAGIKIARRNINNLGYADDTTLMAESKEELKEWKRSVFIPISKKGNAKECSNYRTIALISQNS